MKTEGQVIVYASCNNGTTALVTNTGRLIMFGKDSTMFCDQSGYVTDLLDQHITKVALGKAHSVALNTKGQVFTFGLNNKGQCGRLKAKVATPWASEREGSASNQMADDANQQAQQSMQQQSDDGGKFDITTMCDFDDHKIIHGKCRVCSICRECTGYNVSCVITQSTPVENRIPGM